MWNKKEKEKQDFGKSRKKLLEQNIKLGELKLEEKIIQNAKGRLEIEIEELKKEGNKNKKEVIKKWDELKKLNEEISEKQKEIEKKAGELMELQKQEISKAPDSYFSRGFNASGSGVFNTGSLSGSSVIAPTIQNALPWTSEPSPILHHWEVGSIERKCQKCGKPYYPNAWSVDDGRCSNCKYLLSR